MSLSLRLFLILGSVLTCVYVLSKIRKSKMRTEDSLFWLFFSLVLVVLGIFPGIAVWFAGVLGVQSPVNLVFLLIIFLFAIKLFLQDQRLAHTEDKAMKLAQRFAIEKYDSEKEKMNETRD